MRPQKLALLILAAVAAIALGTRSANAQVAFQGTFAGPHGVVSVDVGHHGYASRFAAPYRHPRFYGTYYRRYPSRYFPSYYHPRYRAHRVFVAFPYPHYIVRRVFLPAPVVYGPGCY